MRLAGLTLGALLLAAGALAQGGPVQGYPAYRTMLGAGQNISLYSANLNFTFAIPIVHKPGRAGMDFRADLVYNSSIYANTGGAFGLTSGPMEIAPGWSLMVPSGQDGWQSGGGYCIPPPPSPPSSPTGSVVPLIKETYRIYNGFYYWDPSGTLRSFPSVKLESSNSCHSGISQFSGGASDGSGYFMRAYISGSSVGEVQVYNPDGIVATFNGSSAQVEDTNGNYITDSTLTSDSTDTTGTQVISRTEASNCLSPVDGQTYIQCDTYTVAEPNGGTAFFKIFLTSATISSNGGCSGITDYSGPAELPVQILLPQYTAGTHWYYAFQYGPTGQISQITYPGGGTTAFAYGTLCTYGDGTPVSLQVTQNDANGNNGITLYNRESATETVVTNNVNAGEEIVDYGSNGEPSKIQDLDGGAVIRETDMTFNGAFPATSVVSLNGVKQGETDTAYTAQGQLAQETDIDWARDPSGATKRIINRTYFYYDRPSEIKVTDGAGVEHADTVIAYDNYASPSGLVASSGAVQHDPAYGTGFTNRDNPTSITRYANASAPPLITYLAYEDTGNVVTTQDANGNRIATAFGNCSDSYASSRTAPGGSLQFSYDCGAGLLDSATDQNNATLGYGYDGFSRLTTVTDPDGGGATILYNDPNNTLTTTKISSSQSLLHWDVRDGFGREIFSQTQGSGWDTVETVYDALGEVVKTSEPYSTGHAPSPGSEFTVASYDGLGRPTALTVPDGSVTSFSYEAGAMQATDPRGVKHIRQSDGLGRLWRVCEVTAQTGYGNCGLPIAGSGFLTTYAYDLNNNLTQVQQMAQASPQGQTRSFSYDWLSRPLSSSDPESGMTSFTYDSVTNSVCAAGSSASAGDLVFRQDAAGNSICLQYDAWHRLKTKTDSIGQSFAFSYDGSQANHSLGRLSSASGGTALSWVYDAMGRPISVSENPAGFGAATTAYSYNYLGEISSLTAPSGSVLSYSYDNKARLASLAAGSTPILASRIYNPANEVPAENLGNAGGFAQLGISRSFNAMGQLSSITFAPQNGGGFTQQYQWGTSVDGGGNVTSKDDNGTLRKIVDLTNANRNMTYSYDDLNRLLSAVSQDNSINVSYSLDAYGNLNQSFPTSAATNRIISTSFQYDPDGRLTAGTWGGLNELRSLTWTPEGTPLQYSEGESVVASYTYGPLGRRAEAHPTAGHPTHYFYGINDGGHPVAEITNGVWQTDVVAGGTTIATLDASGTPTYLALDMLGTTRQTVNSTGTASGVGFYYPYGKAQAAISSEYQWTNQQRDANGTDHFAFRTYSSDLSRWLSPDPAGLAAVNPNNPQSWNRYAYVGGNPLSAVDPLGLHCIPVAKLDNGSQDKQVAGDFGPYSPDEDGAAQQAGDDGYSGCANSGGGPDVWLNGVDLGSGGLAGDFVGDGESIGGEAQCAWADCMGAGSAFDQNNNLRQFQTKWTEQNEPCAPSGDASFCVTVADRAVTSEIEGLPSACGPGALGCGLFEYPSLTMSVAPSGGSTSWLPSALATAKALVSRAASLYCGSSAGSRILRSMETGAVVGAVTGGVAGFGTGELFGGEVTLGATGFGGAALGATIGGTLGAMKGIEYGIASAVACDAFGFYH